MTDPKKVAERLRLDRVDYGDGAVCYFRNGKLHREDGPAMTFANGDKAWLKDGKYHRENGPAYVGKDGRKEWWLNGIKQNPPKD